MKKVLFLGPNGSGKSTQGKLFSDIGFVFISAGNLLRREIDNKTPFGLEYAPLISKGILAPSHITNDLILQEINNISDDKVVILDGFPRNDEQLKFIIKNTTIDLCVNFELTDIDVIMNRSLSRNRSDDTPEVIKERLAKFNMLTVPVIEYFKSNGVFASVDASKSEDEIFAIIKNIFLDRNVV